MLWKRSLSYGARLTRGRCNRAWNSQTNVRSALKLHGQLSPTSHFLEEGYLAPDNRLGTSFYEFKRIIVLLTGKSCMGCIGYHVLPTRRSASCYARSDPVVADPRKATSRCVFFFRYAGEEYWKIDRTRFLVFAATSSRSHECGDKRVYNPIAIHYNA